MNFRAFVSQEEPGSIWPIMTERLDLFEALSMVHLVAKVSQTYA